MVNPLRSLRKIVYLLIGIILFGVSGYMLIEDYSVGEATYMVVQVVTTVGFNEVVPFQSWGRDFTTALMIFSFGTFAYGITQLTQIILNGDLKSYLKYKNVQKKIDAMSGHVIICGFGRNGYQVAKTLTAYRQPFVIIEKDPLKLEKLFPESNTSFIIGNATDDDVLISAGAERAKSLISSLHDDSDNVFVVISARQLNPNLQIVSRANAESTGSKLKAAGANSIIMPNKVGGQHLAHTLMKPDVVQFLDHISVGGLSATNIEEILVDEIPRDLQANNIQDLEIRTQTGCTVIGYKPVGGDFIINPGTTIQLTHNSKLFVLGNEEQIIKLKQLFNV